MPLRTVWVSATATLATWAAIIGVGFALTDFAPRGLGAFWLVCGIGGGLLSWWLGERDARRSGVIDQELGRRHGTSGHAEKASRPQ